MTGLIFSAVFAAIIWLPSAVFAHETYVLNIYEIRGALGQASINPLLAIPNHEWQFLVWALAIIAVLCIVLKLSISPLFEKFFDPFLMRLKKIAPLLVRLTLGISLILSGYHLSSFGPELPFYRMLGEWSVVAQVLFIILGAMIVAGWRTRETSVVVFFVYVYVLTNQGFYGLTYLSYLGPALFLLLTGGGAWSLDSRRRKTDVLHKATKPYEKYGFFVLRLSFGLSVAFASYYAKFLHSNLALLTVQKFNITEYLPFTALFIVLGAFFVELLVGLAIAFGFEIRFFTLVFLFFLTVSIIFFGEALWPHFILFGLNLALLCHGYDQYTLEKALMSKRRRGEPVF